MTGGASSICTVTVNVQLLWLVQLSVAVQVTVVAPTGKKLPEGGSHLMSGSRSVSSLAIGAG